MIGDPAGDVAGVLRQKGKRPGCEIQTICIEHLGIALVQADDHLVVVILAIVDDLGTDLVERREVREVLAVSIDGHQMIVLVAGEVLQIDDATRALPEVSGDIPFGLAGDAHRRSAGARLHEHVHAALVRLHERNAVAVGRDLEAGLLWVPEEVAQRNEAGAAGTAGGRGHRGHLQASWRVSRGRHGRAARACLSTDFAAARSPLSS